MTNLNTIKARYKGATNTRGARVILTSDRFHESKTIPFNYRLNNIEEMALEYLEEKGFQFLGSSEIKDGVLLISTTFKSIK